MIKILLLFIPMITTLLSCSVIPQALDGSQKIRVRVWSNKTPDLVNNIPDDTLSIDNKEENTVEFDVTLQDNNIFMAYTTDTKVRIIQLPSDVTLASLDLPINTIPSPNGPITKVRIKEDNKQRQISYWRTDAAGVVTGPITPIIEPIDKKGVWVRVLKGTFNTEEINPRITWSVSFATEEPMVIDDIKIAHINYRNPSVVAVSNNTKLIVFNDIDQNNVINFLDVHDSSFSGFSDISQVNTWRDGDDTYISAVVNQDTLITGLYRSLNWIETYRSKFRHTISEMQVKMGSEQPYASWINNKNNDISLMIYDKNRSVHDRWLEVDNINSGKHPYLLVNSFKDNLGVERELVYTGIVDRNANYFQLFKINDFQMAVEGPIILDWNERYGLGVNHLNQVLFVRVQPDLNLIFAGLNSLSQWDQIQVSNPPRVRINSVSPVLLEFLNGTYPITFFIQENGSMYVLGGEQ